MGQSVVQVDAFTSEKFGGNPAAICVMAESDDKGFDFVSRFFAPALGVNEDPVTGSAHCVLGSYWAKKFGKTELVAYQASAHGGDVRVRVGETSVTLGGQAVTTMRGELV